MNITITIKVKPTKGCRSCAFDHMNRDMGYDFCEGVHCNPYGGKRAFIYSKVKLVPTTDHIRIWVYWNEKTRIKLIKGVPFRLRKSEPSEEGYSYEEIEYVFDGKTVTREIDSGGCDCDGPISHYSEDVWDRSAGVNDNGYPNWKKLSSRKHDVYAEKMGY